MGDLDTALFGARYRRRHKIRTVFLALLVGMSGLSGGALAQENPTQESIVQPPAAFQQPSPQAEPAPVRQPLGTQAPAAMETQPAAPETQAPASPPPMNPAQAAPDPVQPLTEDPALQAPEDVANATLPHNLSPVGMFLAADWVVKSVMIGLAFASLVTWTVWLAKTIEIAGAKARLRVALRAILGATSLEDAAQRLGKRSGAAASLIQAALSEVRLSSGALDHADPSGLKERVSSSLSRIHAQAGRRLSRGTGVIATIGSTAPFVGLFGTVWGIMNSFIGISESQTTNLAVVAPGIAEALLATAIGLVAAIPAVVVYNLFARSVTGYRQALADAVAGVERLVSRDLDYRLVPVELHPATTRSASPRPDNYDRRSAAATAAE